MRDGLGHRITAEITVIAFFATTSVQRFLLSCEGTVWMLWMSGLGNRSCQDFKVHSRSCLGLSFQPSWTQDAHPVEEAVEMR